VAFSTTLNWTTGQTVTAAQMDAQVSANMDVANQLNVTFGLLGSLTSGVKATRFIAPYAMTAVNVNGSVGVASTTGSVIFDMLKTSAGGSTATTLFTSSSKFVTLTSGVKDGTASVPDVTSISSGDIITVRVVDDGSAAVSDATVILSASGA